MNDEDLNWARQLVLATSALLTAAVVVGVIGGLVALGAARVAGLGPGAGAAAEPSLYMPADASRTRAPKVPDEPGRQPVTRQDQRDRPKADRPRQVITLRATPNPASTNQRIYLRGAYRGGNGSSLQVQRFQKRWVDFPVSATVRRGAFETWLVTGQDGRNRFRVVDESTGRTSKPVAVLLR